MATLAYSSSSARSLRDITCGSCHVGRRNYELRHYGHKDDGDMVRFPSASASRFRLAFSGGWVEWRAWRIYTGLVHEHLHILSLSVGRGSDGGWGPRSHRRLGQSRARKKRAGVGRLAWWTHWRFRVGFSLGTHTLHLSSSRYPLNVSCSALYSSLSFTCRSRNLPCVTLQLSDSA